MFVSVFLGVGNSSYYKCYAFLSPSKELYSSRNFIAFRDFQDGWGRVEITFSPNTSKRHLQGGTALQNTFWTLAEGPRLPKGQANLQNKVGQKTEEKKRQRNWGPMPQAGALKEKFHTLGKTPTWMDSNFGTSEGNERQVLGKQNSPQKGAAAALPSLKHLFAFQLRQVPVGS